MRGCVSVYATLRGEGVWWIDLVRVGAEIERHRGYGTTALRETVTFLVGFLGAKEIGLVPNSVADQPWLRDWYRREGFDVARTDCLWMVVD